MVKIGSVINDRYRLDEEIGQGGSGIVFGGHDLRLKRDVAIKLLNKTHLDMTDRHRLLDEAQMVVG